MKSGSSCQTQSYWHNMLEKKPRSQVSIQPSSWSTQINIPTFLSYKQYCLIDAFLVEIISLLCFNSKFDGSKRFLDVNSYSVLSSFIFGLELGNKDILCVLLEFVLFLTRLLRILNWFVRVNIYSLSNVLILINFKNNQM